MNKKDVLQTLDVWSKELAKILTYSSLQGEARALITRRQYALNFAYGWIACDPTEELRGCDPPSSSSAVPTKAKPEQSPVPLLPVINLPQED